MNSSKTNAMWGYLFITPQVIGMLAFSLLPLVSTFALSVLKWDGFGNRTFVGFKNFAFTFTDPDFWIALKNTAYYTVLTVPVSIFLAIVVAAIFNKVRFRMVYRVFFFMPYVTSSVAVSVIFMWLLNGDFGLLNILLKRIGIHGPNWLTDMQWVLPSLSMVSIWHGLGFNMLLFLAGLQGISATYYEAAMIDGASKLQQFWKITLPLLSPTTLFVTVMSIIGSFQVFDTAFVMTNGGPAKASYTMVYHVYQRAFVEFDFGKSTAAAVCLFIVILVFTLIQMGLSKKWVHYGE